MASTKKFPIFVLLEIFFFQLVQSDHTSLCVILPGVKYNRDDYLSVGMEKFPQNPEIWTHYQESLVNGELSHDHSQRNPISPPGYGLPPWGDMHIYRITKRPGQILNGWFRIEISLKANAQNPDLHESLKALLLFVRDDQYRRQTIGEFSLNFPTLENSQNTCPKNDATKYMIVSCGGASRSEPLVSNMIVFVRDNPSKDGNGQSIFPPESQGLNVVPILKGRHSLNFYVRLPIQDCNQKKFIMFRAKALIDRTTLDGNPPKDIIRVFSAVLVLDETSIPGTADSLPSPSQEKYLQCDERMQPTANLPWYKSTAIGAPYKNMFVQIEDFFGTRHIHACQGNRFIGRCKLSWFEMYITLYDGFSFSERKLREISNQNEANANAIPICEHKIVGKGINPGEGIQHEMYIKPKRFNNMIPPTIQRTDEYLKDPSRSHNCNEAYNNDARCVIQKEKVSPPPNLLNMLQPRQRMLKISGAYTKNQNTDEDKFTGVRFEENGFTTILWVMRKGHAGIMAVVVFFIVPVSLFMTRYFKESFMDRRVMLTRIWYQVHIQGVFLTTTLLIASLIVALVSRNYLGVSLSDAGNFHRVFGWLSVALYLIMMLTGGFRGYEDKLRKITIFLHWLLGTIFYIFMCIAVCHTYYYIHSVTRYKYKQWKGSMSRITFFAVILMMNAVFIPGCGVASKDQSYLKVVQESGQGYSSGAFIHVIIWILFEVIMHVVMTSMMIKSDNEMAVVEKRQYLPVPIPVLREITSINAEGYGFRSIMLAVYIVAAITSTVIYFLAFVSHTTWEGKGLGPMSCTHNPDTLELLSNILDSCRPT